MTAPCLAEYFAGELNRYRPLRDDEVDRLHAAICRIIPRTRRLWKAADDRELQRLIRKRLTADEIAQRLSRTPMSVRTRIRDLKRRTMVANDG